MLRVQQLSKQRQAERLCERCELNFFHFAYRPIRINGYQQIPSSWRIRGEANTGGGCTYLANQQDSNGNTDICMTYSSRGDRTGGSYSFVGRKRADDKSCPAEQPDGGKCEASVEPNVLGLADGTVYNISGLTEEKVQELVSFAYSPRSTELNADFLPPLEGEDRQHRRWCRRRARRVREPAPLDRGLNPQARSLIRACHGTGNLDQARTGWRYSSGVLQCILGIKWIFKYCIVYNYITNYSKLSYFISNL